MNTPQINNLTIQELQRLASIGVEAAIMELGNRVIDYDFEEEVDHTGCEEDIEELRIYINRLEDQIDDLNGEISDLEREISGLEQYKYMYEELCK